MVKNRWVLYGFLLIFLFGMGGCFRDKKIDILGQIIDKETQKGIFGLDICLKIVNKQTGEALNINGEDRIILKTNENGRFEKKDIPIPEKVLKNLDKYEGKISLPEKFCFSWKEGVNLEEMKKKGKEIRVETSYGGAITGVIRDRKTKEVIPDVKVSLIKIQEKNGKYEEKHEGLRPSDKDGRFYFYCKAGRVKLRFSHIDYKRGYSGEISLIKGKEEKTEDIMLEPDEFFWKIDLRHGDDLRKNIIPEVIRKIFSRLSKEAIIVDVTYKIDYEGREETIYAWRMLDMGTRSISIFEIIEKGGQEIRIYDKGSIRLPSPIEIIPASIFEEALNRREFPEELRKVIENKGYHLPPDVKVIKEGNMWIIGGEWLYILRKEKENIEVYYVDIGPIF